MKGFFRMIGKNARAKRVLYLAKTKFDTAVYSCANVSRINNSLSFIIRRSGAFGNPVIEPIQRPDVVIMTETTNAIIVKDGKVYELKTW